MLSSLSKQLHKTVSKMANTRTILGTGANRGIGFSVIHATALRNPTDTYILACRSVSSGKVRGIVGRL